MDFLYTHALFQRSEYGKQPQIVLIVQLVVYIQSVQSLVIQCVQPDFCAAHCLHNGGLKTGCNAHHFAGGFHLGAQLAGGVDELVKGPLGHLDYHIIQGRLKAGTGFAGYIVFNLVQGIAQSDLGGHLGNGIAGGFGRQGGGTADAGIDLNHAVLHALRVQGKLTVAAALNAQLGDNIQRCGTEHLVLFIRQGHSRGNDDGVTGVNAYRVKVFHRAHGNHIAGAVPHHFKFNFFPSGNVPLHQHLGNGGEHQAVFGNYIQLLLIISHATAGSAKCKGRTNNHRVANLCGNLPCVLRGGGNVAGNHRLAQLHHGVAEQLPILGFVNSLSSCAQQGHAHFVQIAVLSQLHTDGQAGLAAQAA